MDLDPAAKRAELLAPELKAMVDQGGPLIMYGVERVNPTVRRLADTLAAGLGGQAVVNGYLSPYKQGALDLHADNHEVVVLQLHGVKRWTIGTKIAKGLVHSSLFEIDNAAVSEHPRRTDKFRSLELHPVDLLYLPRGLVHQATATEGGRYIFRLAFFVQLRWISPSLC